MKNLARITLTTIGALLLFASVNAQDAHFTNAFAHPLKLNPGLMGDVDDLKVILNYRSQWGAIDGGYQTYSFTSIYPLYMKDSKEKIDFGLNVTNDNEGAFKAMDLSLSVGYNLRVSKTGHISFALMGGFAQKSLNAADFDLADNTETIMNEKTIYPDLGFGLMWNFNPSKGNDKLSAFAGVSGFHLNEPKEAFAGEEGILPRKFSVQGGLKMRGENKIDFTPNIIGTIQGGASKDLAAGVYVDYNLNEQSKLTFGTWFRNQDALAFMLGLEHKGLTFAYTYDMTSSPLSRAISGLNTHEITLAYKFNTKGYASTASFDDSNDDEELSEEELRKQKEKAEKIARIAEQKRKIKEQKDKLKEEKKKLKEELKPEKETKVKEEKPPKPPKEKKVKEPKPE